MGRKRSGSWTKLEREYIHAHYESTSIKDMAKYLNRAIEDVTAVVKQTQQDLGGIPFGTAPAKKPEPAPMPKAAPAPALPYDDGKEILSSLRGSLVWKAMQRELEPGELEYFEEEYVKLFRQFKEDVVATEDNQIRKAITFDILMRRNMAARRKLGADIVRMEAWQESAARQYKKDKESLSATEREQRETFLLNLDSQIQALRSAEQSKTKEFSDLDTRHQKLMEALKATRDQRFNRVETNKTSFLSVIRELAEEEKSKQQGKMMALMSGATQREYERLSKLHVYEDGTEDRPILSADTIGDEPIFEDEEDDVLEEEAKNEQD